MRKRKVYPKKYEIKTFHIRYDKPLSSIVKLTLKSFQAKYLYYAIDDVIYLLRSYPGERDRLLSILHSTVISLQNNLCVNFFDIWIHEIYITEIPKFNKFLTQNHQNLETGNCLTIKFAFTVNTPVKKVDTYW